MQTFTIGIQRIDTIDPTVGLPNAVLVCRDSTGMLISRTVITGNVHVTFGPVALGVPYTLTLYVTNASGVPLHSGVVVPFQADVVSGAPSVTDINVGPVVPPPPPPPVSVFVSVFLGTQGNFLSGATVTLTNSANGAIASQTSSNGLFIFPNIQTTDVFGIKIEAPNRQTIWYYIGNKVFNNSYWFTLDPTLLPGD